MFAATSLVGVKPVVRANAGRVRCRATASAAVAPAGLSGMTGFRRAGSIDTLGRGIGSKKTFNGTVAQTLGLAGRPGRGRRFVTKAMFEVRPRKTRADAPPDRSNPTSTRKHRTFGVLPSIARANPRDGSRRASRRDAEATPPSSPRYGNKKAKRLTEPALTFFTLPPPPPLQQRFTEKAIKVVMLAQEEARRLGHNFVGTEQVSPRPGARRARPVSRWIGCPSRNLRI